MIDQQLRDRSQPALPHGVKDLAEQLLQCIDRVLAALPSGVKSGTPAERVRGSRRNTGISRIEKKPTMDDGYIWRKYGQKVIVSSKYPRLYFRCTYRDDDGCTAKRRVQQSESDPAIYTITYFGGEHTCRRFRESQAQFVVDFVSSNAAGDDGERRGSASSPLTCSNDDTQVWWSPMVEDEELRADLSNLEEPNFDSEPTTEQLGMPWPDLLEPPDGCFDWQQTESLFDICELIDFSDSIDFP